MPVAVIDLEREIDRLYQAPLDRFVSVRNALASRLKTAGRRDESERVRKLAKPSMSAWALNQVYWEARRDIDRLLDAGDRLRAAQVASLQGKAVGLRDAALARQQAIDAVVDRAMAILAQSGAPASQTTRQRLAVTGDAIGAYGTLPTRPPVGRLPDDLDPPGFALLAALAPAAGATPGPRLPVPAEPQAPAASGQGTPEPPSGGREAKSPSAAERRAAETTAREQARRDSLARAEFEAARTQAEARRRRHDAERATRDAEAAERRAEIARAEVQNARDRLEVAERRLREAEAAREETSRRGRDAASALDAANAAADRAGRELAALTKGR